MLENGAEIRFIQHLLGHEKLDTTAIYTEVSIEPASARPLVSGIPFLTPRWGVLFFGV
jgi:integrase